MGTKYFVLSGALTLGASHITHFSINTPHTERFRNSDNFPDSLDTNFLANV